MSEKTAHKNASELLTLVSSRRDFLRKTALTAIVGGTAAACGVPDSGAQATKGRSADNSGGTMAPNPAPVSAAAAADAMDRMHEAGIKAFPGQDRRQRKSAAAAPHRKWREGLRGHGQEDPLGDRPGQMVEAWAYNDQVPGPQIRVREGDRVRIVLKNELAESTAVHFHGVELPNDQDGVPFITQPPIKPGETLHLRVHGTQSPARTCTTRTTTPPTQVGLGLLGAFIVEPKNPAPIEKADIDYVLVLNDGMHGYTFNGKSFPGDRANRRQARPETPHPLHERRHDDPSRCICTGCP